MNKMPWRVLYSICQRRKEPCSVLDDPAISEDSISGKAIWLTKLSTRHDRTVRACKHNVQYTKPSNKHTRPKVLLNYINGHQNLHDWTRKRLVTDGHSYSLLDSTNTPSSSWRAYPVSRGWWRLRIGWGGCMARPLQQQKQHRRDMHACKSSTALTRPRKRVASETVLRAREGFWLLARQLRQRV